MDRDKAFQQQEELPKSQSTKQRESASLVCLETGHGAALEDAALVGIWDAPQVSTFCSAWDYRPVHPNTNFVKTKHKQTNKKPSPFFYTIGIFKVGSTVSHNYNYTFLSWHETMLGGIPVTEATESGLRFRLGTLFKVTAQRLHKF